MLIIPLIPRAWVRPDSPLTAGIKEPPSNPTTRALPGEAPINLSAVFVPFKPNIILRWIKSRRGWENMQTKEERGIKPEHEHDATFHHLQLGANGGQMRLI